MIFLDPAIALGKRVCPQLCDPKGEDFLSRIRCTEHLQLPCRHRRGLRAPPAAPGSLQLLTHNRSTQNSPGHTPEGTELNSGLLQTMLRRDPTGFCRNAFSRATHRFAEGSFLPTDLLFLHWTPGASPTSLRSKAQHSSGTSG